MATKEKKQNKDTVTVSFERIMDMLEQSNYLQGDTAIYDTKFGYALRKFFNGKEVKHVLDTYNDELFDIRLDNALVNKETQSVVSNNKRGERPFLFSKEGLKKCVKAERALVQEWRVKEIEVKPYIITDIPAKLTQYQIELFKGIIL